MNLWLFLFVGLIASGYCHQGPQNDESNNSHLRLRRSFWNDVKDELLNDVSGGSSCVQAVAKSVEENPEIMLAKRSIPDHRLSKRGIGSWLAKLNPIPNFYECGNFLKNKGVQIYQVIEQATQTTARDRHTRSIQEFFNLGEELGHLYQNSLDTMITSLGDAASQLQNVIEDQADEGKYLHQAITTVESFLKNYASKFHLDTASNIFTKALHLLPHVNQQLQKLNWAPLFGFVPKQSIYRIISFSFEMEQYKLAEHLMTIINFVKKLSPEFAQTLAIHSNHIMDSARHDEGQQCLNDLSSSLTCVKFLAGTADIDRRIRRVGNSSTHDMFAMMGYLNDALKCGTHVLDHTAHLGDNVQKAGEVLKNVLLHSVDNTLEYLSQLEEHLKQVEKPVKTWLDEEEKLMMQAVVKVKKLLSNAIYSMNPITMKGVFVDVIKALRGVENMTTDWSFWDTKPKKNIYLDTVGKVLYPFELGSLVNNRLKLTDVESVSSNAKLAQSFINVVRFAVANISLDLL